MFGSKKEEQIDLTKLTSMIASNMDITGDVHFLEGLRVDGHIEGNVVSKPDAQCLLVLSDKGSVTGNVKTYDAVVNGHIVGDLEVTHFLELQSNACVTGNIIYRQLRMDCGATVEGKLTRKGFGEEQSNNVVELSSPNTATAASK